MPSRSKPAEPHLTWNTVHKYSFLDLIGALSDSLLLEVPQHSVKTKSDREQAEALMARFTNEHAFVSSLWNRMGWEASQLSKAGRNDADYKEAVQKRDALERTAASLKMKWQTVREMLYRIQTEDDAPRAPGWGGVPEPRKH